MPDSDHVSTRVWTCCRHRQDHSFYRGSHDALIRVYDSTTNLIETHGIESISMSHEPLCFRLALAEARR